MMNSGLLRFKYCIHRRVAENAEMLFFHFQAFQQKVKRLINFASSASRATCRVVARRAKPEAGGEII